MRKLAGLAVIALVLSGCGSGRTTPTGPPATYCEGVARARSVIVTMQQGTATQAEAVSGLADAENWIGDSAYADGVSPTMAANITTLADSIGRLKVAASGAGDINAALDGITAALNTAPICQ